MMLVIMMTEILVSFELITIAYIIVLVPTLIFLGVFAYRIAKSLEIGLLERWNRRVVKRNKQVILDNIKVAGELRRVQADLLQQQLQLKKEYDGDK